jgi:hypothetical protein
MIYNCGKRGEMEDFEWCRTQDLVSICEATTPQISQSSQHFSVHEHFQPSSVSIRKNPTFISKSLDKQEVRGQYI